MIMRFSYATFLALASVAGTDAFLSPALRPSKVGPLHVTPMEENEDFMDALSDKDKPEDDEVEVGSGSSRFKAIMEAAKAAKADAADSRPGVAIDNPFLTPPPSQPNNFDNLSVEEQARMFRTMMQGEQAPKAPENIVSPPRQAKTDRAGRPVGRNRDADQIANAADVYFAQLKRDSTVRTLQRIRGDEEEAEQVFADPGVKELKTILKKNPHLQGAREKEMALLDTVPEEMIRPYFESAPEEEMTSSGIRYKDRLKQMKEKRSGKGGAAVTEQAKPEPAAVVQPPPAQPVVAAPEPVAAAPEPVPQQPVPAAVESPPVVQPAAASPQHVASQTPLTAEEMRQKIRTLMGMVLKHRGGPGFGKGRLQGGDIDRFEGHLAQLIPLLREEALQAAPKDPPMMTAPAAQIAEPVAAPAAISTPAASGDATQIDSTIACIEGAVIMYKNSPPGLRESVLITLRAALMSAVTTCSSIVGDNANFGGMQTAAAGQQAAGMEQIDSMIACIEGALTMYKNSPPELKGSVLVTLQAALMSAVNTCNAVIAGNEVGNLQAYQTAAAQAASVTQPVVAAPAAPAVATPPAASEPAGKPSTDANSKVLEEIYNKVKSRHGDGFLGLKSDMGSAEAEDLAGDLGKMRKILMDELNAGIGQETPLDESSAADKGSTVSSYKKMLSKARAEKAAKAS